MPPNIPAIVLAAGRSGRMGQCKALLALESRPLAEWHARRLLAAGFVPWIISDLDHAGIESGCPSAQHLHLDGASERDPFQTLRLALSRLATRHGALVMPVDIAPPALNVLTRLFAPSDAVPVGPDGRRGHPVRMGPTTCDLIRRQKGIATLRDALMDATEIHVPISVGGDFDTPLEWAAFTRKWKDEDGG